MITGGHASQAGLTGGRGVLVPLLCVLLLQVASAQTRFSYSSGQPLEPAYEGWWPNADGSFTMFFGYMNTNWLQEFEVPVGADNNIQPGGPDQGQPTHFYPRRSPFLFTIRVPKDFGTKELIWTLTANGKTGHAYASLKSDYQIDPQVISTEVGGDNGSLRDELRTNIPPDLKVEGELRRTVKVGQPLALAIVAGDPDNLPARRDGRPAPGMRPAPGVATPTAAGGAAPAAGGGRGGGAGAGRGGGGRGGAGGDGQAAGAAGAAGAGGGGGGRGAAGAAAGGGGAGRGNAGAAAAAPRPPVSVVSSSGPGLRFAWSVYRGKAANVTFTPEQMKTWMDSRAYGNSAWSPPYTIPVPPPDGRWTATATFSEPGTYVLRGIASDGSLFTYENVTVTVTQ